MQRARTARGQGLAMQSRGREAPREKEKKPVGRKPPQARAMAGCTIPRPLHSSSPINPHGQDSHAMAGMHGALSCAPYFRPRIPAADRAPHLNLNQSMTSAPLPSAAHQLDVLVACSHRPVRRLVVFCTVLRCACDLCTTKLCRMRDAHHRRVRRTTAEAPGGEWQGEKPLQRLPCSSPIKLIAPLVLDASSTCGWHVGQLRSLSDPRPCPPGRQHRTHQQHEAARCLCVDPAGCDGYTEMANRPISTRVLPCAKARPHLLVLCAPATAMIQPCRRHHDRQFLVR